FLTMTTPRFYTPFLCKKFFKPISTCYKSFGGFKFPTRILQGNGGSPVLDVTITDVKQNIPATFDVPANIRQAPAATQTIIPEKLAEGVWSLPGGARTVALEFRDYVAVVEARASKT